MADAVELTTQPREGRGSREARRLRQKGLIPAVLYGHKEETVALALPGEELEKVIRHGTHVLDLKTNRGVEKALIKEVQWDYLGKEILHVDFARVAADERVSVSVPIELRGIAIGTTHGGILEQPLHTVTVECLAIAVPGSIRVNVAELDVGQAIHVRQLQLPPDVKALADPEAIVVHVVAPAAAPEAAAAPPAEGGAEPEVISRKEKEEEEGE
ncbi:MAG TPA: 50S ribosomal protein L25 [Gemmataceae bacterium]|nr:50S ribosomal protein L25 [Gemmataceae bacterium]